MNNFPSDAKYLMCSLKGAYLGVCQHRIAIPQAGCVRLCCSMRLKQLVDSLVCREGRQRVIELCEHHLQVGLWDQWQVKRNLIWSIRCSPQQNLHMCHSLSFW